MDTEATSRPRFLLPRGDPFVGSAGRSSVVSFRLLCSGLGGAEDRCGLGGGGGAVSGIAAN